jgi:hypothetical protein
MPAGIFRDNACRYAAASTSKALRTSRPSSAQMIRFFIMELIYTVLNFRLDLGATYLRLFIPVDSTIFDQLYEF